jgi:hypothetical protein
MALRRRYSPLNPPPPPPKRQQKSLFQRLQRRLEIYLARKPPADYVEDYLETLRRAHRGELAGYLATALLAKKTLDTTRQVEQAFPDALFEGKAPLDEAGRAALLAYAGALLAFQHQLEDADIPLGMAVVRGLPAWIASCYALADPDSLVKGREIWLRLTQNVAGVEEAHKLQVRRDPSEVERTYFHYRPAVLM